MYIIQEEGKYGLIIVPPQGNDDVPETLNLNELIAKGGSFITQPQWDEIKANICFDPDDVSSDARLDTSQISCNYYVLKDGRWGILDETGRVIQEPLYEDIIIVNDYENVGDLDRCLRRGFTPMDRGAISGCVIVHKDDKWGMLRGQGHEILPLIYDSIGITCYHWVDSNVYIVCKDGLYGVVDWSGKFFIRYHSPNERNVEFM